MTGAVTISPTSVVDGEGIERADEGLSAEQAMERGFRENPIWQTPEGQQKMAELRELAQRQQFRTAAAQIDVTAAMAARDQIEALKADPLWRDRWAAGGAKEAKELEALIRLSLGRSASPRAPNGGRKPPSWHLLTPAEKAAWEAGQ